MKTRIKNPKNRKKIVYILFCSCSLIIGLTIYFFYPLVNALLQGHDVNTGKSNLRKEQVKMMEDPFSILIIGSDERTESPNNWRPDVLMVAAINPKTRSIKLMSIPRDTKVEIANSNGVTSRINSAPAWGYRKNIDPISNIRETVEELLTVPIDYYVKTNFQGFTKIVDSLGGVDVDVSFPFSEKAIGGKIVSFKKGPMKLSGEEALAYVRMRKKDPQGDHGRNKRQQEVLPQLLEKMISLQGFTNLSKIMQIVGNNISYSFKINDVPALTKVYVDIKDNTEVIKMNTSPKKEDGVWYETLGSNEHQRIRQIFQHHLGRIT